MSQEKIDSDSSPFPTRLLFKLGLMLGFLAAFLLVSPYVVFPTVILMERFAIWYVSFFIDNAILAVLFGVCIIFLEGLVFLIIEETILKYRKLRSE